jgi:sortase A
METLKTEPMPRPEASDEKRPRRVWKPSWLTWTIGVCGLLGLTILLYPTAASWVTQYNQSQITGDYDSQVEHADPDATEQLEMAARYNAALTSGVDLAPNANIPTGTGTSSDAGLDYERVLSVDDTGLMARLMIPAIDVDLPIYHGTDDETLLHGVGHLQGSHLPVGGEGTHSVLTAHRGLASARMFTDLDQLKEGDTFSIQVFGEVLTYRVRNTKVVAPDQTDSLRAEPGEDLVTLVTCTPLGINTHRILVTGERITPTPASDLDRANRPPEVPRFPWWLAILIAGTAGLTAYVWRAGFVDPKVAAARRPADASEQDALATEDFDDDDV